MYSGLEALKERLLTKIIRGILGFSGDHNIIDIPEMWFMGKEQLQVWNRDNPGENPYVLRAANQKGWVYRAFRAQWITHKRQGASGLGACLAGFGICFGFYSFLFTCLYLNFLYLTIERLWTFLNHMEFK